MTKQVSAKQKKKRKRAIRRRRVLLLLLLASAVISICLFTPLFNVKTVEVTGNELISAEQILQTAAVPQEINIFKISKKNIKKAVLQIPEIETVRVRRRLPAKIRLEVTETRPTMYFPYMTGFAVTNENGRVMALADDAAGLDLLYITGLEIKNAKICEKISVQDTVKFDIILDTIRVLRDAGLLSEIRSCHFDSVTEFYLYLTDGTKVIFGKTTDMAYKISVLSNILPKVNRTEGSYIDLTTPSRAIYGTLDEEPPAETAAPEDGAPEGSDAEGSDPEAGEAPESADGKTGDSDPNASSAKNEEGTNERD